jgi:protein gp37
VRLWPERLTLPLQWRRPRRVFLNSMSDLWHEAVGADLIARVLAVIAVAERHTFQVLTKRPGRMCSLLGDGAFWDQVGKAVGLYDPPAEAMAAIEGRFLPNLWLGVSVETQKWAPVRLGKLAATSVAAVRFASCEPLLGELDIRRWLAHGLEWVIAGGESGPGARPMHPDWVRSLRDQCLAAGVPYFFKQWGAFAPEADGHDHGRISVIGRRGQSGNRVGMPARPDAA